MSWKQTFKRTAFATARELRRVAGPRLQQSVRWLAARRLLVLAVLIPVIAIFLIVRAWGPDDDASPPVAKHEARLVGQLLSGDWQAQLDATRTVLESVGVTILEDDAAVPDGNGPAVIAPEVIMLAMDGARKASSARITLADVAQMLADFGFPFPEGDPPPSVLEAGVRDWVADALADPDVPGASAARFLHAMAAQQQPALDLASPGWSGAQYTLTHLELFVFTVAVGNAFPHAASDEAIAARLNPIDRLLGLAFPTAHAATPTSDQCALAGEYYGDPGDYDRHKKNMQTIFGWLQNMAAGGEGAVHGAARAAGALSTLFKLHKLMLLYSSIDMRLTADHMLVHKSPPDQADPEVVFTATVGIEEDKYREFVERMKASEIGQAVRECLASLGLPDPTDMGDVLEELRKWDVSWDLYGDHATWSNRKNRFKSPNLRRVPLEPVSDTHGGADFIVDIKGEPYHEGDIITGYISAKATLHTDAMPGTEVVEAYAAAFNALGKGHVIAGLLGIAGNTAGLTGNLLSEVLGGWAQRMLDPDVLFTVAVTEHRHRYPGYSYEGTVTAKASTNVHDVKEKRSKETRGGHAFRRSTTTVVRQATASMQATQLRPERMSYTRYTERRDTAYWNLTGPSQTAISFNMSHTYAGVHGCATLRGRVHFNSRTSGSGSHNSPGTYRIKIEQTGSRDSGYQIQIHGSPAQAYVPYERRRTSVQRNDGCEFLGPGHSDSSTSQDVTGLHLEGFYHSYSIDEPYPETIAGQASTENADGSTTHWNWNFHRVGPIDEATGKPGGT